MCKPRSSRHLLIASPVHPSSQAEHAGQHPCCVVPACAKPEARHPCGAGLLQGGPAGGQPGWAGDTADSRGRAQGPQGRHGCKTRGFADRGSAFISHLSCEYLHWQSLSGSCCCRCALDPFCPPAACCPLALPDLSVWSRQCRTFPMWKCVSTVLREGCAWSRTCSSTRSSRCCTLCSHCMTGEGHRGEGNDRRAASGLHHHGPLRIKQGAVEGKGIEGNDVKDLTNEYIPGPTQLPC